MTDAVNINAGVSAKVAPPQAAPAAASTQSSSQTNIANLTKPLAQAVGGGISPRIVNDPTAGVILQYLDSKGDVESQTPSATVVAYLRAGLTDQGFSKTQAETSHHSSTTVA